VVLLWNNYDFRVRELGFMDDMNYLVFHAV